MAVVRWTNLLCGVSLVLAALVFLIFLPNNLADYTREPEDVWLSLLWIGLLGSLAVLCFANARRAIKPTRYGWRAAANSVAVLVLGVLLAFGRGDPAIIPVIAVCALGPLAGLVGAWRNSQVPQN
jgi:EamA domain-containing membrane protein RarD